MTRRRIITMVAPLAAAGVLAGCGGGGGGGGASSGAAPDTAAGAGASFVSEGVSANQSAAQASAALGNPGAVDPSRAGETIGGYDDFGRPKDVFVQQVKDGTGGGTNGAETAPGTGAPAATPAIPIVSPPTTGVPPTGGVPGTTAPGGTAPGTGGAPGAPTTTPNALEADFDISGEPVVAREGDAIPPDTQQFTVKTIAAKSVILQLNAGLLPDGRDSITLGEGASITLLNQTAKQKYRIKLVDVRSVN
jgi:hypothetical protein